MRRPHRIDPELLAWSSSLSVEQRIRQADAAFRLFHALHRPFERPFVRGFDSLEEFFAFQKETDLRR
jgi:hypothetical protein